MALPNYPASAPEPVCAVVINYNGAATVLETIRSIYAMDGPPMQVVVLDDCSTDGSPDRIAAEFPEVTLHREPRNLRHVNKLRNMGIRMAGTSRVLLTDNDILFDRRCLVELLRVMDADPEGRTVTCTPRLMFWDEPDRIYSTYTRVHYVGAAIGAHRGEVRDTSGDVPTRNVGGGIMLLDREKVLAVGGFDEDYGIGYSDGELHQRLALAGYLCLYVPSAFALHEEKAFGRKRAYRIVGQTTNRWQYILTHYSLRTLILISPALLAYEGMSVVFLAARGLFPQYLRGILRVVKLLPSVIRKRRRVQAMRVVSDRELLFTGPLYLSRSVVGSSFLARLLQGVSAMFDGYWAVVEPLLGGNPRPCPGGPLKVAAKTADEEPSGGRDRIKKV